MHFLKHVLVIFCNHTPNYYSTNLECVLWALTLCSQLGLQKKLGYVCTVSNSWALATAICCLTWSISSSFWPEDRFDNDMSMSIVLFVCIYNLCGWKYRFRVSMFSSRRLLHFWSWLLTFLYFLLWRIWFCACDCILCCQMNILGPRLRFFIKW